VRLDVHHIWIGRCGYIDPYAGLRVALQKPLWVRPQILDRQAWFLEIKRFFLAFFWSYIHQSQQVYVDFRQVQQNPDPIFCWNTWHVSKFWKSNLASHILVLAFSWQQKLLNFLFKVFQVERLCIFQVQCTSRSSPKNPWPHNFKVGSEHVHSYDSCYTGYIGAQLSYFCYPVGARINTDLIKRNSFERSWLFGLWRGSCYQVITRVIIKGIVSPNQYHRMAQMFFED